jgi:hypothetical protein
MKTDVWLLESFLTARFAENHWPPAAASDLKRRGK